MSLLKADKILTITNKGRETKTQYPSLTENGADVSILYWSDHYIQEYNEKRKQ